MSFVKLIAIRFTSYVTLHAIVVENDNFDLRIALAVVG